MHQRVAHAECKGPAVQVIGRLDIVVPDRRSLVGRVGLVGGAGSGTVQDVNRLQATRDERRYESAMLRTFGASKRRVLGGVAAEFFAIGLLAGVLAAAGATLAGWLLAENLFELDYEFSATLWLAGPLVGVLFVGLSGMAATWRVITHAPVSVLRAG